jgi:hypothetical protein
MLGFLFSESMVDCNREVSIYISGDGKKERLVGKYKVSGNEKIQEETLNAGGDGKLVFSAAIRFKKRSEKQSDGKIKEWYEGEVADMLFTDFHCCAHRRESVVDYLGHNSCSHPFKP